MTRARAPSSSTRSISASRFADSASMIAFGLRVRDDLTPDGVGEPVGELGVHLDPNSDARVVAPRVRVHVEGGVAVEVGRHREVTIGHREIGDPVDSEPPARARFGLVPHDVPVPPPRADGPGLEHPSLPAVGERDRGARTLRLQEREGIGGHGEEDLSAVVVDGRTQDLRVGVGLALEGDDDGAGGGDQRAALARREERGSKLVLRGLGVVRSLDAELGPQDLEVAPESAAQGVVALLVRAERAVRVPVASP